MTAPVQFNVNGVGFKGATIGATQAGLVGVYRDGKPWAPCPASVRAILPHYWRKALDRAGAFWFPDDESSPAYLVLRDTRGRYLSTIYANARASA